MNTPLEVDMQEAIAMLFDAHREQDPFRVDAAMRHLEFLDALGRYGILEDRPQ